MSRGIFAFSKVRNMVWSSNKQGCQKHFCIIEYFKVRTVCTTVGFQPKQNVFVRSTQIPKDSAPCLNVIDCESNKHKLEKTMMFY